LPDLPPQQSNLGPVPPPPPNWQAEPSKPQGPLPNKTNPWSPAEEDPLFKGSSAKTPASGADPALPAGAAPAAVALPPDVTSGLCPLPADGLDALQKKGYKTILHLKHPGADDAAAKIDAEKRGLTYLNLEISPATLSGKAVEDFTRIVTDKSNYPLFVCDKDGALIGGLWYLYFRSIDEEEVARIRATSLGLRPNGEGSHLEMWLAVQKYLSEK
jgi:hypothetical protein